MVLLEIPTKGELRIRLILQVLLQREEFRVVNTYGETIAVAFLGSGTATTPEGCTRATACEGFKTGFDLEERMNVQRIINMHATSRKTAMVLDSSYFFSQHFRKIVHGANLFTLWEKKEQAMTYLAQAPIAYVKQSEI